MRVKRFQATDMRAALEQVRGNLGPNAIILSTRGLPSGRYGGSGVEVLAGAEERTSALTPRPVAILERAQPGPLDAGALGSPSEDTPPPPGRPLVRNLSSDDIQLAVSIAMAGETDPGDTAGRGVSGRPAVAATVERTPTLNVPQFKRVTREGDDVEDLEALTRPFAEILRRASGGEYLARGAGDTIDVTPSRAAFDEPARGGGTFDGRSPDPVSQAAVSVERGWSVAQTGKAGAVHAILPGDEAHRQRQGAEAGDSARDAARRAFALLRGAGISDAVAEPALAAAIGRLPAIAVKRPSRLVAAALDELAGGLPEGPALSRDALSGTPLFVTGPAGAGKTTALLKMAVHLRQQGAEVAIIGADISRLGGAEQLLRYGQLLRLPVTIAYSPEQLTRTLEGVPRARVTLIDTPALRMGAVPRAFGDEVLPLLTAARRRLVTLVVSAVTSGSELGRLAAAGRALDAEAAIVTRLDEVVAPAGAGTPAPGVALNVVARLGLPPLLVSSGRDVLADAHAVSAQALAGAASQACAAL